jgi:hypothetical protein
VVWMSVFLMRCLFSMSFCVHTQKDIEKKDESESGVIDSAMFAWVCLLLVHVCLLQMWLCARARLCVRIQCV